MAAIVSDIVPSMVSQDGIIFLLKGSYFFESVYSIFLRRRFGFLCRLFECRCFLVFCHFDTFSFAYSRHCFYFPVIGDGSRKWRFPACPFRLTFQRLISPIYKYGFSRSYLYSSCIGSSQSIQAIFTHFVALTELPQHGQMYFRVLEVLIRAPLKFCTR